MDEKQYQLDKNEIMLGTIGLLLLIALLSRIYKLFITIT
jgi:hypothetical protein